jgi:hypothetical protein
MEMNTRDLGRVLAFWKKNQDDHDFEKKLQALPDNEKRLLDSLQKRLETLASSPIQSPNDTGRAYSDKMVDVLLLGIFLNASPTFYSSQNPCNQLRIDLNNNLDCFEHFSDVMRSYYHSLNEFEGLRKK